MVDLATVVAEDDWYADVLYGDRPPTAPVANEIGTTPEPSTAEAPTNADPGNLQPFETETPDSEPLRRVDPNAGAKRAAAVLGVALVATVALVVGLLVFSGPSGDSPQLGSPMPAVAVAPVSPIAVPPAAIQDQAVAFTASADCPPGSTSAQTLTDTTHDSAWVCVRGPAGARVDGQVLHVDFGTSHVLTAVAVTPGWVAKATGGQDEWLQHRVVSRLQYGFNDDDHTIVTQDTGNAHGPVTLPLPRPVLASRVTVIILQTARPPSSPLPTADPGDLSGVFDPAPGDTGQDGTQAQVPNIDAEPTGDPVDATFAMSRLQFFGHSPR